MRRTTLLLTAGCVALLSTLSVIAYNCGDTWQPSKADATTEGCNGGWGLIMDISRTKYWRIFWRDGYERNDVAVSDSGQCRTNLFGSTYCWPEFNPPEWTQNSDGFGEWDQMTRSARYNSTVSDCDLQNEPHHHYQRYSCPTTCNEAYAPDAASADDEGGGATPNPNLMEGGYGGCACDQMERDSCSNGGGEWHEATCSCISPVVVDVAGDGFDLTDGAGGVPFDFTGDGAPTRLAWTRAGSDDAWLAFDRNGNGVIDSGRELFGSHTPQPAPPAGEKRNGFLALAVHDRAANGGNADGVIDGRDAIFTSLRLWQDTNHNGVSEAGELHTLAELGVSAVHLGYHESKRTDENGNRFRYRAKVDDTKGLKVSRWAWDVFPVRPR